jgi:hypothetical protein
MISLPSLAQQRFEISRLLVRAGLQPVLFGMQQPDSLKLLVVLQKVISRHEIRQWIGADEKNEMIEFFIVVHDKIFE